MAGPPDDHAAPGRSGSTRILIVEDNHDAAAVLQLVLESQGHEVDIAHSGEEALSNVRSFEPDVVLCDIGLPGGKSGYDVARSLRGDPSFAELYLVALSGLGYPEDIQQAEDAGFDAHVLKPVDIDELAAVLARAG